jgi:tetratricopeptide (TPR) repeat protein
MIHWPARVTGQPARVEQPGGLIDVAPTILNFLGVPAPASFAGASLLPSAAPRAVYSETLNAHDSFGWAPLRGLRLGAFMYIEAPRPELYDLSKDPGERNNIVLANPGQARALRSEMARYARRGPTQANGATPQNQKLLNSLGYLSPGPRTRLKGSDADPKDRLPEYQVYKRSMAAVANGRLGTAAALLLQILAQDPTNTLARRDLGSCYLDLHDYAKARASLTQVTAAAPDDYASQFGLGIADKNLGLLDEARTHFETACRIAPQAMQCRRELDALKPGTE